jgi:hypothetical protein
MMASPGRRKTHPKIIVLVGEIQLIEPVAGIVAVPVERFRAQQIAAGMQERHSLPEQHRAQPDVLHTHPLGQAGPHRRSKDIDIEQGLVIVLGDISDLLLRVERVAGRGAVVIDIRPVTRSP